MHLFDTINFKKKNRLLWLGSALFMLVVYQFAFKKTIQAYQDYQQLKKGWQQTELEKEEKTVLRKRLEKLNAAFLTEGADTLQFRDELLSQIGNSARQHDLLITAVPKIGIVETEGATARIFHVSFYIEGDFIGLLKLTEEIEKELSSARISSVSFSLKEGQRGAPNKVILHMQLSKIVL